MPKNCKGCVRYKLLTMYQYVQSYSSEMLFFMPFSCKYMYLKAVVLQTFAYSLLVDAQYKPNCLGCGLTKNSGWYQVLAKSKELPK